MTKYKCLACGEEFEAPVKVANVRHNKYGGCTWGIGKKVKPPKKPTVYDAGEVNGMRLTVVNGMVFATPKRRGK